MSTDDQEPQAQEPQSLREQQAAVREYLSERGYQVRPAPADKARADLDALLDGRPQLATLALNLVTAALDSGTVVTNRGPMSSRDITSTLRRGRRSQLLADRAEMIEGEFPVELHPMALALAQLADTRKAGEKAVESTPAMIRRAKAEGMKPADIARLLKVSDSHVYAVLRKKVDQEAVTTVEKFLGEMTGAFAEADREVYERRRAHVPAGQTLYNWRLDLHDGPDGAGWRVRDEGDAADIPGSEARLALAVLADAEADDEDVRRHRARVLVWEGPEGTDDDALYFHKREPAADTATPPPADTPDDK
ncbi:hypothetical protein [Streptomyces sp. NPDC018045]|uniref:hypothetical protein n=1 Tax=Streptomyces sp. NPDC018045 TaxID=3365037 RepID=UPI0037B749EE